LIVIGIFFLSGAMDKTAAPKDADNINLGASKDNDGTYELNKDTNNNDAFDLYKELESYNHLTQSPNRPAIDDEKMKSLQNWLNSYINSLDSMDQAVYKALQNINLSSKEVAKYAAWHEFGRKVDGNRLSLFVWAYTVDCKDFAASINLPVRIDMIKIPSDKFIVLDTHVASKSSYYAKDLKKFMEEYTDDVININKTDIIKNLSEKVIELDKKAMESIEKENLQVADSKGIFIDGYLAEITTKGEFDNASIYISADTIKGGYLQVPSRRSIPIYQSYDTELIKEVFDLINDESLWGEYVDDNESASKQLNKIVDVSIRLVFYSNDGFVYIGLGINPTNHKMYAECIWHRYGNGKTVKVLSCKSTDLYPVLIKKLIDIDIDKNWIVSGNLDRKDIICYSTKNGYSMDETLSINAVIVNNEGQIESFPQNISGWIKMSNEKDTISWDDIKIELHKEDNLLIHVFNSKEAPRTYKYYDDNTLILINLIKVNLENSGIKPGKYTVEGMLGDYTIDKFEVEIKDF